MKKWFILIAICLAWSLMWVDFTAVNVALAPIAADLHTNIGTLQWVITAYTLTSAALMTTGGRLGDIYGHRRLFIIGTLIFIAASALAGFAPNATLLILSRIGQGIGISMVIPITTALVYLTFEEKKRGLALGILTGTTGIAMAIGPTVGGLLITYLNWRWVFFINIPIGLLGVIMASFLIQKSTDRKKSTLDYPGIISLTCGLLSFLFALNQFSTWGFSIKFFGLLLTSILILMLFVKIESQQKDPLIHLELLKNKALLGIISVRTCAQYVFFVYMFMISLYLENILGFSGAKTGYLLLISTFVLGVLSPFAGHLLNHFSTRFLIAISCFILIFSLIALICMGFSQSMPFLYLSLILFGLAYAIHFPTTNLSALQTAPSHQSALVTGILFTMAFAGASAGITISSTLLNDFSKIKLSHLLLSSGLSLTSSQQTLIQSIASGAQSLTKIFVEFPAAMTNQISSITEQGFIFGFTAVFTVCLLFAILGIILTLLFVRKNQTKPTNKLFVLDV